MVLCRVCAAEKWDAVQTRRAVSGMWQSLSLHMKDVMHEACPDLQCELSRGTSCLYLKGNSSLWTAFLYLTGVLSSHSRNFLWFTGNVLLDNSSPKIREHLCFISSYWYISNGSICQPLLHDRNYHTLSCLFPEMKKSYIFFLRSDIRLQRELNLACICQVRLYPLILHRQKGRTPEVRQVLTI